MSAAQPRRWEQPQRVEVHYSPSHGDKRHVGSLALDRGEAVFQYTGDWLAKPLPLAPLTMPPGPDLIRGPQSMPGRLHGLFADSLPDAWGHVLADRHFAAIGLGRERITPLGRLALAGANGMGALTYSPAIPAGLAPFTPDLDALSDEAERVLSGSASDLLPRLIAAAGTSGGARPKVLIGLNDQSEMIVSADRLPERFEAWLVKLASTRDGPDSAAVEYAYSRMAVAAGLRMPPTRLLTGERGARHFAIQRFDRTPGGLRVHSLTASGLLDVPADYFAVEYGELGAAIARLCQNYGEAREFARRMVFNVLAHNRDDHLKNTTLLMDEAGAWRLSPAYDLVPMAGPGGEHSMLVGGEGRAPLIANVAAAADAMGVEAAQLRDVVAEVTAATERWDEFADDAGLQADRRREIALLLDQTRRTVFGH